MPQYSRWGQMKLLRVRHASVAAGRRSGNSSRLPLPEPILAAVVMTMAWGSNGHDVDLAVGAWLGAVPPRRESTTRQSSWTMHLKCVRSFGCAQSVFHGAASLACRKSSGTIFTDPLPSSGSKRLLGNKSLVCYGTREPPRTLGPRDGR